MAEIQLGLEEKEQKMGNVLGSISWLTEGLNIKKSQYDLKL